MALPSPRSGTRYAPAATPSSQGPGFLLILVLSFSFAVKDSRKNQVKICMLHYGAPLVIYRLEGSRVLSLVQVSFGDCEDPSASHSLQG